MRFGHALLIERFSLLSCVNEDTFKNTFTVRVTLYKRIKIGFDSELNVYMSIKRF